LATASWSCIGALGAGAAGDFGGVELQAARPSTAKVAAASGTMRMADLLMGTGDCRTLRGAAS
jgi:hypothetical protein